MGKVIKFPEVSKELKEKLNTRLKKEMSRTRKMKHVSDRIDALLIDCLNNHELEAHELAGLLAHRLGALIKLTEDKAKLLQVCESVLKKQAINAV